MNYDKVFTNYLKTEKKNVVVFHKTKFVQFNNLFFIWGIYAKFWY